MAWKPPYDRATIRTVFHLQALVMKAATNLKQTDNKSRVEYTEHRLSLKERGLLKVPLPEFLIGCDTLDKFWEHIRVLSQDGQKRAWLVAEAFSPYWRLVPDDVRPEAIDQLEQRLASRRRRPEPAGGPRTAAEQLALVRSLAPVALDGVQWLIEERERLQDRAPSEALEAEAIADLRALHAAVGELCRLAEEGKNISDALQSVEQMAAKALAVSKGFGRRAVGVVGPPAAVIIGTCGLTAILEEILDRPIDGAGIATLAGAIIVSPYLIRRAAKD